MCAERTKAAMTVSKAILLITDKYSCEMVERHVRALHRIVSNFKTGVPLKDLPELCQLVRVCVEKPSRYAEYEESLCSIVALCSLPFLKEKVSDENTYAPCVIEMLSLLGTLMTIESDSLRRQVAQTVADFYTAESNEALAEGLQATAVTYNAALVERSSVTHSLAEALHFTLSGDTRLNILKTLHILSASSTNCNHILSAKACSAICSSISCSEGSTTEAMSVSVELMWNILEHGSPLQVAQQMNSLECIRPLHYGVTSLVTTARDVNSKHLRNDLLTLCSLISKLSPDAPFVETGFLQSLCYYFLSFEVTGTGTSSSRHGSLASSEVRGERGRQGEGKGRRGKKMDDEDFEFVKTLMVTLTTLSSDQLTIKVLIEQKVMRCLLSFVVRNDHTPSTWSSAHFEELQLLALSCLCTLGPLCLEEYLVYQGNTRLLLVIEWCYKTEGEFKGHGNAFHGHGGHGNRLAQLRMCVRALLSICRTRDELVLQDLHEQGAIPLLVGLQRYLLQLSDRVSLPAEVPGGEQVGRLEERITAAVGEGRGGLGMEDLDPESSLMLELQSDILLTVSCLCETDIHRKELFGGYDGVKLLISHLNRADSAQLTAGLGHHRLLLAATDCVWCTVIGNPVVEDIFLEEGGVFCLLDLLQVCPHNNQSLVLGVLVDLCENPKAIPHVMAWRGRETDMSSWSLLASLWRQEETEMGVPRGDTGTLAGTDRNPLVGQEQEACGAPPIPSHQPSASIIDITENMRAKIYVICCKMGFQYPSDDLPTEDKITLCIIRNYLDFKSGEVWYEVAGELTQEGLRPVTPDQEALQEILHSHEEKAENTLRLQSELIEEQHCKDGEEEQQFFDKIQQLHYAEEKARADFSDLINRTSNYKALQEAKRHQLDAIDRSRRSNVAIGDRFHSIGQSSVNVTAYCGRHISIATTPLRLLTAGGEAPSTSHTSSPPHTSTTATTVS